MDALNFTVGRVSSNKHLILGGLIIVSAILAPYYVPIILVSFPAVVPAKVQNLNSYRSHRNFNNLFKLNSFKVNCSSVIKITWDPPSNYNETVIDYYKVTVHVGPGTQHNIINVTNTEWTFIPSELPGLVSLYYVHVHRYNRVATNLSVDVSVSAVDICGRNGTSDTYTLPINKSDLFCYGPNLFAIIIIITIIYTMIIVFLIVLGIVLSCIIYYLIKRSRSPPCAQTTSSPQPAIVSTDLSPSKQQSKVKDDLDTTGQQNNPPKDYEMDIALTP